MRIGDVFEIDTGAGLAYLQCTHFHALLGSLVRAITELATATRIDACESMSRRGEAGAYPITAVWLNDDPLSGWLVIDGEPIVTTPVHRFFVLGRGWIEAGHLKLGDLVPSALVRRAQHVARQDCAGKIPSAGSVTYRRKQTRVCAQQSANRDR